MSNLHCYNFLRLSFAINPLESYHFYGAIFNTSSLHRKRERGRKRERERERLLIYARNAVTFRERERAGKLEWNVLMFPQAP